MTVGERIKEVREKTGMSQVDFADKINVSKQTLYKYENNLITNIPSDKIEAVARVGGVSPAYLMGWDVADDSLLDYFDNTLYEVISFLEKSGYTVIETDSWNDDTIIIKNKKGQIIKTVSSGELVGQYEHLKADALPLTIENILNIQPTGEFPENIRAAARGMMELSPEDQKTAIDMINYLSQKGKEAKKD